MGIWHYGQLKKGEATYIWANGIKARVTVNLQGEIRFTKQLKLLYPDDDFRQEYEGEINDNNVPHGQGTMTFKDGK